VGLRRDAQGLKRINDGEIPLTYPTRKLIDELGSHARKGWLVHFTPLLHYFDNIA